ncbi:MAG: DUF4476 domain-containing protein [Candidatus Delongbacteria bacterium]|nr:DUF4476 domain-containing protein [Candidatus Delongbacteria bacterium]MBN2836135.1 DUF4476 domain-containing protein [Candidatus Delongbacteria bacterium]
MKKTIMIMMILCWSVFTIADEVNKDHKNFKSIKENLKKIEDICFPKLNFVDIKKIQEIEKLIIQDIEAIINSQNGNNLNLKEIIKNLDHIISDTEKFNYIYKIAISEKFTVKELSEIIKHLRLYSNSDKEKFILAMYPRIIDKEKIDILLNQMHLYSFDKTKFKPKSKQQHDSISNLIRELNRISFNDEKIERVYSYAISNRFSVCELLVIANNLRLSFSSDKKDFIINIYSRIEDKENIDLLFSEMDVDHFTIKEIKKELGLSL